MRILIYPRNLDSGDSQRGAVEMAGAMAATGNEVTVLGASGLLVTRARELGVEVVLNPVGTRRRALRSAYQLAKVARERDVDVIHAFEWESIAMAFFVTRLFRTKAVVTGTVHSHSAPPVLPRTVPLLMGSRNEAADRRSAGYTRVGVLEPWVNTSENDPALFGDPAGLRARWGLDTEGLLITVATSAHGEPSTAALAIVLDVVKELVGRGMPVQALVIGDGPRRVLADERAAELNARFKRTVVVAVAPLLDRREAFAAADVVIGSDSSVLHGMAFAKPVVVEGARGYFRAVNHATVEQFQWTGWYGTGGGAGMGKGELLSTLEALLDSSRLREYRGAYSRELSEGYGVDEAAVRQLQEYRDALDTRVGRISAWADLGRVATLLLSQRGQNRLRQMVPRRRGQDLGASNTEVSLARGSGPRASHSVRIHESKGYDGNRRR